MTSEEKKEGIFVGKNIINKCFSNNYIRCILCGSSGTGKTFSLLNFIQCLEKPEQICIYCNSMHQPVWKMYKEIWEANDIDVQVLDRIPSEKFLQKNSDELLKRKHTIFIFDDLDTKELNNVTPFYKRSRSLHCSVILLNQDFTQIPKEIKRNTNVFSIFFLPTGFFGLYMSLNTFFNNDKKMFDKVIQKIKTGEQRFFTIDVNDRKNPLRWNFSDKLTLE